MNLKEFRELTKNFPDDVEMAFVQYEGGFHPVTEVKVEKMIKNYYENYTRGPHESVEHIGMEDCEGLTVTTMITIG